MGGSYSNIVLKGPDQATVAKALEGRAAVVSPSVDGCTVVFDSVWDNQDTTGIAGFLSKLSGDLHCAVWAMLVHDDDVFWYQLYLNGALADEYNSNPSYFDFGSAEEPAGPSGGDAGKLCTAFGVENQNDVEAVLRKSGPSGDGEGYVFETERHADLIEALGLPAFGVGKAYASFERGEYPEGLSKDQIVKVT